MNLFNKFKEKVEDGLMNAAEKMEESMTLKYADNFISAYNSSNFDYMERCIKNLEESASSQLSVSARFFAPCAKGIFIISSGLKNPPIPSEDILELIVLSSNIKRFNIYSNDDKENELHKWFYEEFDKLVKMNNLRGIGW